MKPIAWIVGGFALSGLAAALEGLGDLGTGPTARLPLYLPALLILLGGQYCLWRGFRSGIAALWSGAFDRREKSADCDAARPTCRIADADPAEGFDADAAFARYMAQRSVDQPNPAQPPTMPVVVQPTRPTFGRRAV